MRINGGILVILLAGIIVLSGTGSVYGGSVSARMRVTAVVPPMVSAEVIRQADTVRVTPSDIRRGYVVVRAGTVLRVETNTSYIIYFERSYTGPFSGIEVTSGGSTVRVDTGGTLYEPYSGKPRYTKVIDYTLFLSADARPGLYPWPLVMGTMGE